jgi:hypothetical protein
MSFISVSGPHYIKRTLVFVNSYDRIPQSSVDGYEFAWQLEEELQQVFSIELVQYSIPRNIASTFLGQFDSLKSLRTGAQERNNTGSNMRVDIELVDETGTQRTVLEATMDPIETLGFSLSGLKFLIAEQAVVAWVGVITEALVNSTHPVLNSTNYSVAFDLDDNDRVTVTFPNTGPATFARARILNGTGPNRSNQSSIPMGFIPDKDGADPVASNDYGISGEFTINLDPFHYLNLYVKEVPEFQPLARVYTVDESKDNYVNPCDLPHRVRIMKNPIRNMKTMGIRVRAKNDFQFSFYSQIGLYFTFELLSIAQVPKVPDWVIQRLSL